MKILRYIVLVLILFGIFNINTTWAGTATLSWGPPTTNADGTQVTDLAGYMIYYRAANSTFTPLQDILLSDLTNPSAPEYTVNNSNLVDGNTYDFVVTAYDTSGNESVFSNVASKLIGTTTGGGDSSGGGGSGGCGRIKDVSGRSGPSVGKAVLNLFLLGLPLILVKTRYAFKRALSLHMKVG